MRERRVVLPIREPGERQTKQASDQNIMPVMAIVHGTRYRDKSYFDEIRDKERKGKK